MKDDILTAARGSGKWASFFLSGEMFAVRVEDVQEVLMLQPLTPVPLSPDYIVGLLNLRGQIMPAVDLRKRLRYEGPRKQNEGNLLVLRMDEHPISVIVDEIGDVLDLPPSQFRPPPDTLHPSHRQFIFGICPIERRIVLGLRVKTLCSDDDWSV